MATTPSMTFIYALFCPITNRPRYIGKSDNPKRRYNNHLSLAYKRKTHKDNWICKLKENNLKPKLVIIEKVNINNWQNIEKMYIKLIPNLTNHADGGQGSNGYKHTDLAKEKISKGNLGKVISEEHKNRIRETWKGRKHSQSAKKQISISKSDQKEYKFYNNNLNVFEFCSKLELQEKYNLSRSDMCRLVNKTRKSVKGWRVKN